MNRARFAIVAALATVAVTHLLAQTPKAPEFKSILADRKVEPPIKGQAEVDFMQPVTKRNGDVVTTTVKVKNMSAGPIARLTVAETWFDKGQTHVAGGQGSLEKILTPGRGRHGHDSNALEREDERQQLELHPRERNGEAAPRREIDERKAPAPTTAKKK